MVLLTVVAGWIASAISVMKFLCSVPLECFFKKHYPKDLSVQKFSECYN